MIKERFTVPPFACKDMEGKQGSGLKKDRNTETPLFEMRSGVFNCKGILNK